jgi:hypothetical protein
MSVRALLSKTVYPQQCLEDAAVAYSAICSVSLTGETSSAREVEITHIHGQAEQPDENRIAHEFLNYLLDLSLEYHLQAA